MNATVSRDLQARPSAVRIDLSTTREEVWDEGDEDSFRGALCLLMRIVFKLCIRLRAGMYAEISSVRTTSPRNERVGICIASKAMSAGVNSKRCAHMIARIGPLEDDKTGATSLI